MSALLGDPKTNEHLLVKRVQGAQQYTQSHVRESISEQVGAILTDEGVVGHARIGDRRWIPQRCLNGIALHQVEELGQERCLALETCQCDKSIA